MYLFLGLGAGVLSTLAFVPYVRDVLRGDTQPERASWLIWSVLSAIAFGSQVYEGATVSLGLAAMQMLGTQFVFLLSLKRGVGALLRGQDLRVLLLAALGLVLWALTETALFALGLVIAINLMGGWVTMCKAYTAPQSETLSCWALLSISAALGILSVERLDPALLAYPVYLFAVNGGIAVAILLGRKRFAKRDPFVLGLQHRVLAKPVPAAVTPQRKAA